MTANELEVVSGGEDRVVDSITVTGWPSRGGNSHTPYGSDSRGADKGLDPIDIGFWDLLEKNGESYLLQAEVAFQQNTNKSGELAVTNMIGAVYHAWTGKDGWRYIATDHKWNGFGFDNIVRSRNDVVETFNSRTGFYIRSQ